MFRISNLISILCLFLFTVLEIPGWMNPKFLRVDSVEFFGENVEDIFSKFSGLSYGFGALSVVLYFVSISLITLSWLCIVEAMSMFSNHNAANSAKIRKIQKAVVIGTVLAFIISITLIITRNYLLINSLPFLFGPMLIFFIYWSRKQFSMVLYVATNQGTETHRFSNPLKLVNFSSNVTMKILGVSVLLEALYIGLRPNSLKIVQPGNLNVVVILGDFLIYLGIGLQFLNLYYVRRLLANRITNEKLVHLRKKARNSKNRTESRNAFRSRNSEVYRSTFSATKRDTIRQQSLLSALSDETGEKQSFISAGNDELGSNQMDSSYTDQVSNATYSPKQKYTASPKMGCKAPGAETLQFPSHEKKEGEPEPEPEQPPKKKEPEPSIFPKLNFNKLKIKEATCNAMKQAISQRSASMDRPSL